MKYHRLGQYFLRNGAEVTDQLEERIVAFYTENLDKNMLDPLSSRDYVKAIKDKKAFFIEDGNGKIVSNSFCFPFCDGTYTETGGTRVVLNGFGLQSILLSARIVSEYLVNTPDIIFSVTSENELSKKNIIQSGFESWNDPSNDLIKERDTKLGVNSKREYFRLSHSEGNPSLTDIDIKKSAQCLINLDNQPTCKRPKRDNNRSTIPEEFETIELILDIPVITNTDFKELVKNLARGLT